MSDDAVASAEHDLAAQYAELYAASSSSSSGASRFLKFCRTTRTGHPAHIAAVGVRRADFRSSLGDDQYWLVVEQTLLACLLASQIPAAEACLVELLKQFGSSSGRVARLAGMVAEAKGDTDGATGSYLAGLDATPTNSSLMKRVVVLSKEKGDLPGAVSSLSDFLAAFGSDADAWLEMAEMQLALSGSAVSARAAPSGKRNSSDSSSFGSSRVDQAIFCMEELILLQPNNPAYHARISELICRSATEGLASGAAPASETNLRMARLHACEAVRLTRKLNAYSLAALADASYLHWCALSEKAPAATARLLFGGPLAEAGAGRRTAAAVSSSSSSASSSGSGSASSTAQRNAEAAAEATSLHRLALHHLRNLSTGPYAKEVAATAATEPAAKGWRGKVTGGEGGAQVSLATVYPALALEIRLLASDAMAALQAQAAQVGSA